MYNDNFKFVDTHEWVGNLNGDVVTVGITHHAQELLGDLVYIELPEVGKSISFNDVVGVVESVKAASDLYSPATGTVTELNDAVVNDPTLANIAPHTDGWLFRVKLDDVSQLDSLMTAEQYKAAIGA